MQPGLVHLRRRFKTRPGTNCRPLKIWHDPTDGECPPFTVCEEWGRTYLLQGREEPFFSLRLGKGAQHARLVGPGGQIGDVIRGVPVDTLSRYWPVEDSWRDKGAVRLVYDEERAAPGATVPLEVTVEREDDPAVRDTRTIWAGGYDLRIRFEPDTLIAGRDTVSVFFEAIDRLQDYETADALPLPPEMPIYPNGALRRDTTTGAYRPVRYGEAVPYEEARSGELKSTVEAGRPGWLDEWKSFWTLSGRAPYYIPTHAGNPFYSFFDEWVWPENEPVDDPPFMYDGLIVIYPYFDVQAVPDPVAALDTARVHVEAIDKNDPTYAGGNFNIDVRLTGGPGGRFVWQRWRDSLWVDVASSPALKGVPYAAADTTLFTGEERLVFIAEAGGGTEPLEIKVTRSDDPELLGFGSVTPKGGLILTFSEDPDRYLPEKGDLIKVTATIHPSPPEGGQVTFALTQADEFVFADGTSGPKVVEVDGNAASVTIKSLTWWGVASVKAAFTPAQGSAYSDEDQLPTDTDGDGMADSWERNPDNGGTLAIEGNPQDGDWDKDKSPGNSNDGDGFTKWGEYQGVLIGKEHMRLTPEKKEVFFDISEASAGQYAVAQVEQQLGIEVHEFDGTGFAQGSLVLRYLGVNERRHNSGKVVVVDAGVPTDPAKSGEVIQQGKYTFTGTRYLPSGFSYAVLLGETLGTAAAGGAKVRAFEGTIHNIFQSNSIPESYQQYVFPYPIVEQTGYGLWTASYNKFDINSDGDVQDLINPFDLLSPSGTPNDAVNNISAGFTQNQLVKVVTLHEIGHALGMATNNNHPTSGRSPMRSGWGPAAAPTYSPKDIQQVQLK